MISNIDASSKIGAPSRYRPEFRTVVCSDVLPTESEIRLISDCDDQPATEPDERERVQAELDAAAFHAYGLDREQTAFVCDDFHQVQNLRRMTDDYFDLVLEKYDELSD